MNLSIYDINLLNCSRSIHVYLCVVSFVHSFFTLLLYLFISALLQVFQTPSLKYCYFTQKKQHKSHGSNRDALPLVQCTNAYPPPPHQNRPVFSPPLENEGLFEKIADSKESIFPIRCWLLVRSVCGECFWGVLHPVLFLSIALISPKLYVFCCLEPDSKASKVRNTWQSVLPPSMKATTKASLHSATRLDPRKSV